MLRHVPKRILAVKPMMKRDFVLFLIVGSMSTLIDFLTYSGIVHSAAVSVGIAKGSSFLVGTVFTYCANRFWIFCYIDHQPGSLWRFGFLYMLTLGANVLVNAVALKLLHDVRVAFPLAFITATGISASLNYLGMKWFVFKAKAALEVQ